MIVATSAFTSPFLSLFSRLALSLSTFEDSLTDSFVTDEVSVTTRPRLGLTPRQPKPFEGKRVEGATPQQQAKGHEQLLSRILVPRPAMRARARPAGAWTSWDGRP